MLCAVAYYLRKSCREKFKHTEVSEPKTKYEKHSQLNNHGDMEREQEKNLLKIYLFSNKFENNLNENRI